MTITVAGTTITFNDSTTQATAARGGITTVTLTSAAPNSTLTSASNKYIVIQTDSTKPINPSVTLPAINTLATGATWFSLANTTPYIVAVKSSDGVTREFILPGSNYSVDIKDASTATGQWNINFPTVAVAADKFNGSVVSSSFKVNSSYTVPVREIVKLDATTFALVWSENTGNNGFTYAQPFTVNTTTNAVTAGTRITVNTFTGGQGTGSLVYDSDGAGHALCLMSGGTSTTGYMIYFGLSYSAGTLAASTVTTTSVSTASSCGIAGSRSIYVGYLGSNNAFAFAFAGYSDSTGITAIYTRGCTVTGTTSCTVTDSASNTSSSTSTGSYVPPVGSRTGLTTFTWQFSYGATNVGRAIAYTPASNTFAITTRSNQALLVIENGTANYSSSFAQGGFMYSTGKAFLGINVYDITNEGAAGVTAVLSTGFNWKYNYSAGYQNPFSTSGFGSLYRSALYVSGTNVTAVDIGATGTFASFSRFQCDPSVSTLNMQQASGVQNLPVSISTTYSTYAPSYNITLLSASLPIYTWIPPVVFSSGPVQALYVAVGSHATAITL
jgi:hypothetical protein